MLYNMFSKCTLPKNFSELSAINFPTNYINPCGDKCTKIC